MEKKHSLGKWRYLAALSASENSRGYDIIAPESRGGHIVATVMPIDMDGKEGEANACLIAAAPELLEALKRTLHIVKAQSEAEHMLDGFAGHKPRPTDHLLELVEAAISKATP